MKFKISKKFILILSVIAVVFGISSIIYATQLKEQSNYNNLILAKYERQKMDIEAPIEIEISKMTKEELPKNTEVSEKLLTYFEKDISKSKDVKEIYDKSLNRNVIRVTLEDAEIDFSKNGDIVGYKNFDDFSTVDKHRKDYKENEELLKIDYKIKENSNLLEFISVIEEKFDLRKYKLIECSNSIEGVWILTWNKEYENKLVNPYDCINIVIDAKDGSIMLFGKNEMEPNDIVPEITQEKALELAKLIIQKFDDAEMYAELTFFRPNFYFEEGGPYDVADFVRLSWQIYTKDHISVQIDAITGEILGGDITQAVCARAMSVVQFPGYTERASLAASAFSRLGYTQNQAGYTPVTWTINQADIDWMLSRTDMYGLYLLCHGGIIDGLSVLADAENLNLSHWQVWSNRSFGVWRFVYLDACYTSANNNFANAFKATYAGECFVGWNNAVNTFTALDFNRRFLPRLGTMTVHNAVVTSLWESRNAGYSGPGSICDPGFIGDLNYYGWAW